MTTKPTPAQAGSPATNAPHGMNADSGWPNTEPTSPAQPSEPPTEDQKLIARFRELIRWREENNRADVTISLTEAKRLRCLLDRAAAPVPVVARPSDEKWTDDDLYDAYLRGCEDDAIPEPLDKGTFLAAWDDTREVQ